MRIITRRQAMTVIANAAAMAGLAACSPGGESQDAGAGAQGPSTDLELLASVAYDIMPYDSISPELYVTAAEGMLAGGDPVVTQGLAQLRAVGGGTRWKDLDEDTRIAALESIEGTPFFGILRSGTMNSLFASQEVWDLVGYGGEAVSKGGYIDRGFDEIDWLPQGGGN